MVLVGRLGIAVAGRNHHPLDAQPHQLVEEAAIRTGSAPSNKVELVVTRKPRASAALIARTAMSYTPSRATARSCSSRGHPGGPKTTGTCSA